MVVYDYSRSEQKIHFFVEKNQLVEIQRRTGFLRERNEWASVGHYIYTDKHYPEVQSFVLLSELFYATNAEAAKSFAGGSGASPHHLTGEEEEPKSGEVMLVTNNHSITDCYCEAGKDIASLDSVPAKEAVIYFWWWQPLHGFLCYLDVGGLFCFLAFMKLFPKQDIIQNNSTYQAWKQHCPLGALWEERTEPLKFNRIHPSQGPQAGQQISMAYAGARS